MNKKILMLTLMLLAMLTLTIIPVQAGKGQDKLDFTLYVVGWTDPDTGERWGPPYLPPPIVYGHGRDIEWIPPVELSVTVDGETYTTISDPVSISYSVKLDWDLNLDTFVGMIRARDTITFYEGTVELGTLEILAVGSATFVGHGTGALEGVTVKGTTSSEIVFPYLEVTRDGTVMGWSGLP